MVCIYCGSETHIYNSRHQKKTNQVWRRRRCLQCGATLTTLENIDFTTSLLVTYPNKPSKRFERDKLYISVYDCLKHRKNAESTATALTATILSKLWPRIQDASLERKDIVQTATEVLKRFDKAAATQYTAYHPL